MIGNHPTPFDGEDFNVFLSQEFFVHHQKFPTAASAKSEYRGMFDYKKDGRNIRIGSNVLNQLQLQLVNFAVLLYPLEAENSWNRV